MVSAPFFVLWLSIGQLESCDDSLSGKLVFCYFVHLTHWLVLGNQTAGHGSKFLLMYDYKHEGSGDKRTFNFT